MKAFVSWTLWNLFLATIPIILGYLVAELARPNTRNAVRWVTASIASMLWLAFAPNTCYLVTEWRHFLALVDRSGMSESVERDPRKLFDVSVLALFYLIYSGFGIFALTLSVRPIESAMRRLRLSFTLVAPFLFVLISLGVYLGLIVRLNSWDIWVRPGIVWVSILDAVNHPKLFSTILAFGMLLWGCYEAVDIWVDGVKQRLRIQQKAECR
jgi:uncharacterized membrane protein